MASPTRLNLLPYLQAWDGAKLHVRLLVRPRRRPQKDLGWQPNSQRGTGSADPGKHSENLLATGKRFLQRTH